MRILLIIAFGVLPFLASATLEEAEKAYEQGEYETALAFYLELNEEQTSAGLLYNIGNCYFKLGELGESVLYYERAGLLAPGDEDIRANLALAREQVVDRIAELPTLELGNYWDRFKAGSDVNQWARISLWTCLLGFLALIGIFYVSGLGRKLLIALAALLFVVTVFSVLMAASRKSEVLRGSKAIIMVNKVDVKSSPNAGSTDLFLLHEGTKVDLLREEDDWTEIRLANGKVGWMPSESLEAI